MNTAKGGHLLGMSFDAAASPEVVLDVETVTGQAHGWGFAWYPGNEHGAMLLKDPIPTREDAMAGVLRDWDRFRGTTYLCHVRGTAKLITPQDAHPFSRSYAGRDWVLAHSGELDPVRVRDLPLGNIPVFEPVGRSDSERVFCWLLTQIRGHGARRLSGVGWAELRRWLHDLNELGTLNLLLSDGIDLVAYHDEGGAGSLYDVRCIPPHKETVLRNKTLSLDLGDPLDQHRSYALVATEPMSPNWRALVPGQMVVLRRSVVVWDSEGQRASGPSSGGRQQPDANGAGTQQREAAVLPGDQPPPGPRGGWASQTPSTSAQTEATAATIANRASALPRAEQTRTLRVTHETLYQYDEPVERSVHTLRLRPVTDERQLLVSYDVNINPEVNVRNYQDVFGNRAMQLSIDKPYERFHVRASSVVRLTARAPEPAPTRRMTIPLVWMPWQRQMMLPYLLPMELPESELGELTDFAMSFVERNDFDLLETLLDINRTIHRDFRYLPGKTSVETTPFDVYVHRRGVCQDFANLFICLAQLLNVPARYRVGYIHTGADYANQLQSEASHAWAEVYLPWTGWRGFDPTNGCLAGLDHIRVACGRHFRDATPTAGTIYKGGTGEKLKVTVKVEPLDEPSEPSQPSE